MAKLTHDKLMTLEDHLRRGDKLAYVAEIATRYRYALIGAGGKNDPMRAEAEEVVAACPNAYLLTHPP